MQEEINRECKCKCHQTYNPHQNCTGCVQSGDIKEQTRKDFFERWERNEFSVNPSDHYDGEDQEKIMDYIDLVIDLVIAKEQERITEWTNKNYSRSTQPLYVHVDAQELVRFINTK